MKFSSLSESGFIPTGLRSMINKAASKVVLISFREWLHSYNVRQVKRRLHDGASSHLFQRVASFLLKIFESEAGSIDFSSHLFQRVASFLQVIKLIQGVFDRLGFSSLSESGFIPTIFKKISNGT